MCAEKAESWECGRGERVEEYQIAKSSFCHLLFIFVCFLGGEGYTLLYIDRYAYRLQHS